MTSTEKETSHGGDATTVPNVDTLEDSHCMYCWLMQANQPAKEVEEINRLCYFWTMLENDLRDEIVNEVGRQGDKWEDEIGEGTHGIDGHSMSLLAVLEHMCHDHGYDNTWKTHESSILEQVKNLYDGGSYESEWEVVEKGECARKELCSDIRQAYKRATAKVNAHSTAYLSKKKVIKEEDFKILVLNRGYSRKRDIKADSKQLKVDLASETGLKYKTKRRHQMTTDEL